MIQSQTSDFEASVVLTSPENSLHMHKNLTTTYTILQLGPEK